MKKTTRKTPSKTRSSARKAAKKTVRTQPDAGALLLNFFIDELKDIYWAENHLLKALPKMAKAATSDVLRNAFEMHLEETEEHVARLERVFELLDKKAQGKKCEAMAGLVEEGQSIISDTKKGSATRDVGLILAAQKVEHYEIATYGGLAQLAKTLGMREAKELLGQTLSEEKAADEKLTDIAESSVNDDSSGERD